MMPFRSPLIGAAEIPIISAVQDFETGTSTGTQDYTTSTLSGITPKAALIIGSYHNPANDPGETPHAQIMVGCLASNGTAYFSSQSQDNVADTNSLSDSNIGEPYRLQTAGSTTALKDTDGSGGESGSSALISGGIRLSFQTNTSPSLRAAYIAFAGDSVQSNRNRVAMGTGASAISVSVGFEPDVVFVFGDHGTFNNTPITTGMKYQFGIAVNNGDGSATQRCVICSEQGGQAAGKPLQTLLTDAVVAVNSQSTGALVAKAPLSNLSASGFDLTPSASFQSRYVGYLALNLAGKQTKLVDFDTPTSTGAFSVTGAGFTPSAAIVVLTNLEATDSYPGSTSDLQSGFAICLIGDEQWATAIRIDSGAGTTDTASQCKNAAMIGPSASDCDAFEASLTAWTSDGATFSASAVQGAAKKGFILFIE